MFSEKESSTQSNRSSTSSGEDLRSSGDRAGNTPTISSLPDDILIGIFRRLPAKYVGRCRCISRGWRDLLSQPQFIQTHLDYSMNFQLESLVLSSVSGNSLYFSLSSDAHHLFDKMSIHSNRLGFADQTCSLTKVCASCHGLVLVEGLMGDKFVLNPITRVMNKVPRLVFSDGSSGINGGFHGLGYDSASDDYKIVSFCPMGDDPFVAPMDVYVFSLKNGTWKKVECGVYKHGDAYCQPAIFLHGCIHWLSGMTENSEPAVMAFDLLEEKFRKLPSPSAINVGWLTYNKLAVLGGCLCMFDRSKDDVWVMKEYGVQESWTKLAINHPAETEIWLVCCMGPEHLVMLINEISEDEERLWHKFVLYSLKHGTWKDIVCDRDLDDIVIETSFVESLVSPKGSDEG